MLNIRNMVQDKFGSNLIYLFNESDVKENTLLAVIKDEAELIFLDNVMVMKYSDDFESKLNFNFLIKNRQIKQIISYQDCLSLIKKNYYGTLSFSVDDIPYGVFLNHIYYQGRIFFHTGLEEFKLNDLNHPVSYLIVEDYNIDEIVTPHNHHFIMIQGTLEKIVDNDLKKEVLISLMEELTPRNLKSVPSLMIDSLNILELKIKYIHGKKHID